MKMYRRAAALAAALILTAGISVQAEDTTTTHTDVDISNSLDVGTNEHDTSKPGMTVNNKGEIHMAGIWNNNGSFGADGSGNVAMTDGTANGNFTVTGDLTVGDMNVKESIEQNAADIANNTTAIEKNAAGIERNDARLDYAEHALGNGVLYNHATNLTDGMNLNTVAINKNAAAIEQETADRVAADQQLQQGIDRNSNAISSLNSRVSDLGGEIDQVGALSAALAGLHPLNYDGTGSKFQLAAAMGDYDGNQAVAFGGFYHFNKDLMLSAGGATSFEGDKKSAYNVGVSVRIGKGSSGKAAVNEDILAEIKAMNEKIAALEAENKSLTEKVTALEAENTK